MEKLPADESIEITSVLAKKSLLWTQLKGVAAAKTPEKKRTKKSALTNKPEESSRREKSDATRPVLKRNLQQMHLLKRRMYRERAVQPVGDEQLHCDQVEKCFKIFITRIYEIISVFIICDLMRTFVLIQYNTNLQSSNLNY